MKFSKMLPSITISLIVFMAWVVFAQDSFDINSIVKINSSFPDKDRAKAVTQNISTSMPLQNNELLVRSETFGTFLSSPVLLNGRPLDYAVFSPYSKGELTLTKGKAVTGELTQIPFYVYLRRNGTIIQLHGAEISKVKRMKIDVDTILKYAKPDDQLIIDPANKEDWQAKRILELLKSRC